MRVELSRLGARSTISGVEPNGITNLNPNANANTNANMNRNQNHSHRNEKRESQ